MFSVLSIFLLASAVQARQDCTGWITSTRVTDWGNWGAIEFCPDRSFASGFDLKIEDYRTSRDDTALNAITLFCTNLNGTQQKDITSSAGPWGYYHGRKHCPDGLGIGFELRSEPKQGRLDDKAAIDFTLICANNDGARTHVKGYEVMNFGYWATMNRMCPRGSAICGIRTQVESPQGRGDDTALNNVDLACCRVI